MSERFDRSFDVAVEILEGASELAREWFNRGGYQVRSKADGSPVTEADRDVEMFLRQRLEVEFPEDGILGEEFDEKASRSGARWILDPIDGTKSFVRGVPLYATLLAYEVGGEVVFGGVRCPSAGQFVCAQTDRGCFELESGVRLRVSDSSEVSGSHVMCTWLEDWPSGSVEALQGEGAVVRTWGDAFGYCLVAKGYADAMVDFRVSPFDVAPMAVVIRECGGVFGDLSGGGSIYSGNAYAAASPALGGQVLDLLGSI